MDRWLATMDRWLAIMDRWMATMDRRLAVLYRIGATRTSSDHNGEVAALRSTHRYM